ncbi:MAG: coproporphyrinogen III oxidase [Alphaproteobacteria bacterium]|nr:MAG: coproporphyrinogen III oxidase [Alphaproteobacteria bacterium]PZO37588.1 MAG: coproporphyrinogen III oxidase [Alphaproteobacteria bacterium]
MTDPGHRDSLDPGEAVGVYVHWPYCARICPYCDFNVVRDRGRTQEQAGLVDAMIADLNARTEQIGRRPLASVFFGGGTPSLMPPEDVGRILAAIHGAFTGPGPVEVTLEANPTDAEAAHFSALADVGINRLSLGVQSLDDMALRFLGRNHDAAEARRAIALAAQSYDRMSIDLIYARPDQTVAAWTDELTTAVDLGFEHISPYQLTLNAGTAFGRAQARGTLVPPDEDRAADLYETTQEVLRRAGFEAYEVSNHARGVNARSVHNLHVWRGGDYLGLGPGAHGRLTLDGHRTATVGHRAIRDYVAGVAADMPWSEQIPMDATEAAEEKILLGLRTVEGVAWAMLQTLALTPDHGPLADLVDEGFLRLENGRVIATSRGRPVLDAVLGRLLT